MKKVILILILAFTITMSGCNLEKDPITIGFAATLTGTYASVGTQELYGVQLAVEEINEAGGIDGREVILEVRDDEADPDRAVQIDNEFIDMGINLVIGHALSIVATEVMENAEGKDILFLSPSIGTEDLSDIDDFMIRNVPTTKYEGKVIAEKMIESNPTKLLMIYNMDNFVLTKYHRDSFIDVITENGYTEDEYDTLEFYSASQSDFDDIEEALSSGMYDSVFFAGSNVDAAPIINHISSNDIDVELHLSSWAGTGLIGFIPTTNVDFIRAYFSFDINSTNQKFLDYQEAFKSKFNEEVTMLSSNAYDLMYVLKEVIEATSSTDTLIIKEKIIEMSTFNGVQGAFSFNQYGDCIKEFYQMEIVDGEYRIKE